MSYLLLLNAPKISSNRKKELIAQIFSGAHPAVVNTLLVLLDKKRINEVADVAE